VVACAPVSQPLPLPQPVPQDASGADAAVAGADASADQSAGPAPVGNLPAGEPVELVVNDQYLQKALQLIQTSKKRLDIVQFEAKTGDVIDILVGSTIEAHKRGVAVRVLLDDEIESNLELIGKLKAAGITQARLDNTKVRTHVKLIWSEQAYMVGSTNWSQTSITKNNEANVLVRESKARTAMSGYVDALWLNSGAKPKVVTSTSQVAAIYADGGYEAMVAPLIDGAKKRIQLCVYQMNLQNTDADSPLVRTVERLKNAIKRGVKVQVVLDLSGEWSAAGNELNAHAAGALKAMGVEVRMDPVDKITHAKFLVVDDSVVLGSNNWGYGGFVLYHEGGLRSHEAKFVASVAAYFDKIWATSKAF